MKYGFKHKFMVLLLISSLSISTVTYAYQTESFSDLKGHWAEQIAYEWVENELITGYSDGSFQPDKSITRTEFITMINRSFGFMEEGEVHFSDVAVEDWAYPEVAKAMKAGYIHGFPDGTFGMNNSLSRQEAAVILHRLLLSFEAMETELIFSDANAIASWAKTAVLAMSTLQIISGYDADKSFKPENVLTRAEAVVVLDRAIRYQDSAVFAAEGIYGPSSGLTTVHGNVAVSTSDVTLRNMEITGNLHIASTVGDGDVYLINVTVKGTTIINGGGQNSIHIMDTHLADVEVDRQDAPVRVSFEGKSKANTLKLNSEVKVENAANTAIHYIEVKEKTKAVLLGNIKTVEVTGNAEIELENASIIQFIVSTGLTNVKLNLNIHTTIIDLVLDSVSQVTGQGTIKSALLSQEAENESTFFKEPEQILIKGEAETSDLTLGPIPAPEPAPEPAPAPTPAPAPAPAPAPQEHHHDHDQEDDTPNVNDENEEEGHIANACNAWSLPSTWDGAIPTEGSNIVIPADECVVLDMNPPELGSISIYGQLIFDDTADRHLTAEWIMVHGEEATLEVGTSTEPFQHQATITLNATNTNFSLHDNMGTRGLFVMDGRLALYGKSPDIKWTKLNAHAASGATALTLAEAVDWEVNDQVVIAPTDYYGIAITDSRSINAVNAGGLGLVLNSGLSASRWGLLQYPDPVNGLSLSPVAYTAPQNPAPTALDERAEIGNLTRSIVIQGPDDTLWQTEGFGAQLMIMGLHSEVVVDGVQFHRMGQAGLSGRYPFHWHRLSYDVDNGSLLGDATGHVLRNSVINQSSNRCVTIHGTNGVLVEDNICYDIRGHALFVEDAIERRNTIRDNLVLHVRNPEPGDVFQQHDANVEERGGASGLWLTNPDNIVTGNAVADIEGNGYWLAFPSNSIGLSAAVNLYPRHIPFGTFEDNTAHSVNKTGVNIDDPPIDSLGNTLALQYQPTVSHGPPTEWNPIQPFTLRRITLYKNRENFWNRVVGPRYEEFVAADATGKFFAGSTSSGFIRRSLIVGTSLNNANTWETMAANPQFSNIKTVYPPSAFASYHGGVAMENNTVINFPSIDTSLFTAFGSAPYGAFGNDDYYIRPVERSLAMNSGNLLINALPGRRSVPLQSHFVFAGAIADYEGLFGDVGNYWVYDNPFFTHGADCDPVEPIGSNGQSCNGQYFGAEAFVLDHANDYYTPYMGIEVSRRDMVNPDSEVGTWSVDSATSNMMLPNMRHFAMREDGIFVLTFPGYSGSLHDVNMEIGNMHSTDDSVVLAVQYKGTVAHVFATTYESYARGTSVVAAPGASTDFYRGYQPLDSREAVLESDGETYYFDDANDLVWIKLRGGIDRAYTIDSSPFSDETLYNKFVLRIHDEVAVNVP